MSTLVAQRPDLKCGVAMGGGARCDGMVDSRSRCGAIPGTAATGGAGSAWSVHSVDQMGIGRLTLSHMGQGGCMERPTSRCRHVVWWVIQKAPSSWRGRRVAALCCGKSACRANSLGDVHGLAVLCSVEPSGTSDGQCRVCAGGERSVHDHRSTQSCTSHKACATNSRSNMTMC